MSLAQSVLVVCIVTGLTLSNAAAKKVITTFFNADGTTTTVIEKRGLFGRTTRTVADPSQEFGSGMRKNRAALDELKTFAGTIRDEAPDLGNHLFDVAARGRKIARDMGLTEEMQDIAEACCLGHDLGQVKMLDLLRKRGKLDQAEWSRMKTHPQDAELLIAQIVRPSDVRKHAMAAARGHQEKDNGKGYPDGKRRGALSFFTRLTREADIGVALGEKGGKRGYRDALSSKQQIDIIWGMYHSHEISRSDALRMIQSIPNSR
jgi:HD-GYP domain-containing protein (c-di-GMP phosphodiesterase class II)